MTGFWVVVLVVSGVVGDDDSKVQNQNHGHGHEHGQGHGQGAMDMVMVKAMVMVMVKVMAANPKVGPFIARLATSTWLFERRRVALKSRDQLCMLIGTEHNSASQQNKGTKREIARLAQCNIVQYFANITSRPSSVHHTPTRTLPLCADAV